MGISKLFAEVSCEELLASKKNSVKNRQQKQQKYINGETCKGKFLSKRNKENIVLRASAAISLGYLSSDRTVC
jgi:hypothetical protein